MAPALTCHWENQTCMKCSFCSCSRNAAGRAFFGFFFFFLEVEREDVSIISAEICTVHNFLVPSHRCGFSRDDICSSGRDWTKCTLPCVITLVETCSLTHWSSCEPKLGFKSPFTCKRNNYLKKKGGGGHILSAKSKLDFDSTVWELEPPAGPPATLLIALSSLELLLANFKEFTSKVFGRHRTAQAEVVVFSFSRASEVVASWGVLFYFPIVHSMHSKTLTAFMGVLRLAFTHLLNCAARGESAGERQIYPALAEQRNLKFSYGEKFCISSPSFLNIRIVFIAQVQALVLPLRDFFFCCCCSFFFSSLVTLLILISPTNLWFLFSASWDLISWQLPITIIVSSVEIVCGTLWMSNVPLHKGRLQLLLAPLLWKPGASWGWGSHVPLGLEWTPLQWDGTWVTQKDVLCASPCLNILEFSVYGAFWGELFLSQTPRVYVLLATVPH